MLNGSSQGEASQSTSHAEGPKLEKVRLRVGRDFKVGHGPQTEGQGVDTSLACGNDLVVDVRGQRTAPVVASIGRADYTGRSRVDSAVGQLHGLVQRGQLGFKARYLILQPDDVFTAPGHLTGEHGALVEEPSKRRGCALGRRLGCSSGQGGSSYGEDTHA